jgi:uncharacterized protein with PIN domain
MKIIKEGKLPGKKIIREKCDYCKTVFEFEESEARYSTEERDGNARLIVCPFCKKDVWRRL